MNIELFIAQRLFKDKDAKKKISRPIVSIAVVGVALGMTVMILSVAIVTGFKSEIRQKMIGFGSHIQILNHDTNTSYETLPVDKDQNFYPGLDSLSGIKHIQIFGIKAGILKTKEDIQGAVLKGIGNDFNWSFFKKNLIKGEIIEINDSARTDDVVISNYLAKLLKLDTSDYVAMYFVEDPPRMRRFKISGIYDTGLEEFDQKFILADIKHIQKLNNWSENQISGFEVIIDDFSRINKIAALLKENYTYNITEDGSKLRVLPITQKHPQIFDWLNLTNVNVYVILILIILVAGINMVSGLLIIILERTSMIGLFKSFGSRNWNIRRIFLYFTSLLVGKGLIWGNIIGILLCLIQYQFGIFKLDASTYYLDVVPINLNILHIILLNAGTLLVTYLMLLLPSYIITKISPIKTIRFN
ncbi:MAG: FtsX-like permease family protein [Bacteroidales bacterium]